MINCGVMEVAVVVVMRAQSKHQCQDFMGCLVGWLVGTGVGWVGWFVWGGLVDGWLTRGVGQSIRCSCACELDILTADDSTNTSKHGHQLGWGIGYGVFFQEGLSLAGSTTTRTT